ncbi:MAG: sigma-54-dependent Fis family transcriptional regulator [Nitrospirae bacterium]|nr:sigma-54-dependent Fis family transcriptional regulator [Candidatus Manganitrophaceae bacterium]
MEKVLIVDNEKSMRDFLTIVLKKEGYLVETAEDGDHALKILEKDIFDVVLTDMKMPRMSGLDLLKALKDLSAETIVIMMTAYASTETAIEAMKEGAYDYLTKPFQIDEVKLIIRNALERRKLRQENTQLRQELKGQATFTQIIGKSEKMRRVLDLVRKVADSRSNILIYGESGTGKELIARAIHYNSSRRDRSFVTVNCSALPEALLESELFGHMKGSFTGAIGNKEGLFEIAHEGSIFLDEIGETSLSIQVKLLRVLQEREFRRVGGTKDLKVDVRIIAATNRDLEKMIAEGKFREDLYYRLDVIPIDLPPLRERPEDIPLLADFFLRKFTQSLGKEIDGIEPEAVRVLMSHEWKGNVRELENVVERAVALSSSRMLTLEDFNEGFLKQADTIPIPALIPEEGLDLEGLIGKIEKELLLKALQETNWVKKEAAKLLHLNFRSFRYRLDKYGIKKYRNGSGDPDPSDEEADIADDPTEEAVE